VTKSWMRAMRVEQVGLFGTQMAQYFDSTRGLAFLYPSTPPEA
jgi:hypothetical protein